MSAPGSENVCRKNVLVFVHFGSFLELLDRYKWNVPYILDFPAPLWTGDNTLLHQTAGAALRQQKTPPLAGRRFLCSVSKKPRRVCRLPAAKNSNHFLLRHVRERKYFSGCKCEICSPQANKLCAQQTANPLSEKPQVFRQSQQKTPPLAGRRFLCVFC